jgi:hypothetical protein
MPRLTTTGEVIKVKKKMLTNEFWLKEDGSNQVLHIISHDFKFLIPGQRIALAEPVIKFERLQQLLLF